MIQYRKHYQVVCPAHCSWKTSSKILQNGRFLLHRTGSFFWLALVIYRKDEASAQAESSSLLQTKFQSWIWEELSCNSREEILYCIELSKSAEYLYHVFIIILGDLGQILLLFFNSTGILSRSVVVWMLYDHLWSCRLPITESKILWKKWDASDFLRSLLLPFYC